MHHSPPADREYRPGARAYLACYGLYAVVLLTLYAIFLIWMQSVRLLLMTISHNSFNNTAFYALLVILVGLVLFVVAISTEPYLRNGVAKHRLLPRFATVAGWLVGAMALGLALQALLVHLP